MSGCVLALFLSLTSVSATSARATIAQVGVTVMAALSTAVALAFVLYSLALGRTLMQIAAGSSSSTNGALVRRMLATAAIISAAFVAESVFWLLSIFDQVCARALSLP